MAPPYLPRLEGFLSSKGGLLGRARTSSFNPLSLSPALWLSADSGLYQERTGASATTPASADGDSVGTWLDISGNARHLTASSDAVRPTLKLAIQNGRSVVRFDGVDDYLRATFTLAQPTYLVFVSKIRGAALNARWLDGKNIDSGDVYQSTADSMGLFAGAGPVAVVSFGHTQFRLAEVLFSGASSYTRLDGGTTNTGSAGTSSMGGITLGGGATPSNYSPVDFAELLVFSSEPSAGDRALLLSYLNGRWGVY